MKSSRESIGKKRALALLPLLLTCLVSTGQAQGKGYQAYANRKTLTEMEWRLTRVNEHLAPDGIFTEYDKKKKLFFSTKSIHRADLLRKRSARDLRAALLHDSARTESALNAEFPEFRRRGSRDLIISFRLEDGRREELAVYQNRALTFRDAYYEIVREIERPVH